MTLGPIWCHFATLTLSFEMAKQQVVLQGLQAKLQPHLHVLCPQDKHQRPNPLLGDFHIQFQEPTGLSPIRKYDHSICLLPGFPPVPVPNKAIDALLPK